MYFYRRRVYKNHKTVTELWMIEACITEQVPYHYFLDVLLLNFSTSSRSFRTSSTEILSSLIKDDTTLR